MKKIITIDGLASSGKSTLSKKLSQKIKWKWLSSGVLYRGLAYVGHQNQLKTDQDYIDLIQSQDWKVQMAEERSLFFYKGQDVTTEIYKNEIDDLSSLLSAREVVRKALIPIQREFHHRHPQGLIIEGRDSGTVIFPEAPLKIFLEAPEQVRSYRRSLDRQQNKDLTLKMQKERDKRDQTRHFAPVKKPEKCMVLNSQTSTPDEIVQDVYGQFKEIFLKNQSLKRG